MSLGNSIEILVRGTMWSSTHREVHYLVLNSPYNPLWDTVNTSVTDPVTTSISGVVDRLPSI